MNNNQFEFTPLGNIVCGLESDDHASLIEIKAELISKGYDPDAFVLRMQAKAKALSASSRLSWMQHAELIQQKLDTALRELKSWTKQSATDINQAFNDVKAGRYGPSSQLRLNTAFKNVTELTIESKAAFLDEIDLLSAMDAKSPDSEKQ